MTDVAKPAKGKVRVVFGDPKTVYGRKQQVVTAISCTCGNTDLDMFSVESETTLSRKILGIVRGDVAVGHYGLGDEVHERIICTVCFGEDVVLAPLNIEVNYALANVPEVAKAKEYERVGDSHFPCQCEEDDLLTTTGISYRIIETGNTPTARAPPGQDTNDVYLATPMIRGWFTQTMQLMIVCPWCDGSLLRKKSQQTIDGIRAEQNLRKSADDTLKKIGATTP